MSQIFISYKREDQDRVRPLVQALQKYGLSVWWDVDLPAGEEWRFIIERELDAAQCVIVVWTKGSVGPGAPWVREEASRAQARGALLPVHLDRVGPPLGFGELHSIDLTHWRSSARDPFVLDVVAAARAKIEGRPIPPPKGPMKRLMRRVGASSATAMLAILLGFGMNAFGIQDRLCAVPLGTHSISDACGFLGLGGRATHAERIAWEQLPRGSCAALRHHVAAYPRGAYSAEAAALLTAPRRVSEKFWVPIEAPLDLYVDRYVAPSRTRSIAEAAARQRGQKKADKLCASFPAGLQHQLDSSTFEVKDWICSSSGNGQVCGFDGMITCHLRQLQERLVESCGDSAR